MPTNYPIYVTTARQNEALFMGEVRRKIVDAPRSSGGSLCMPILRSKSNALDYGPSWYCYTPPTPTRIEHSNL